MTHGPFSGLLVPMLTPFADDLSVDMKRAVDFCQNLLSDGADGIVLFGTTGEASSLTMRERRSLLELLRAEGVPGERLIVGLTGCSLIDTVDSLRHSQDQGAAAVLLLPPFFYKQPVVTDDGLFDYVGQVIQRSQYADAGIYLYHIPQVAQIGWSFALIRRLIEAFPDAIVGVKDSAGDWEHTKQLIHDFPELDIFPGFELTLLSSLQAGGLGCITATGNINLQGIRAICECESSKSDRGELLQERATAVRLAVQNCGPPLTVMKSFLALKTGDSQWANVRPPLTSVSSERVQQLDRDLQAIGYDFPFD